MAEATRGPWSAAAPAFSAAAGWQAMVFVGVVTVILGLIVALHPSGSLNVIAVLVGVLLVISGIFDLVSLIAGIVVTAVPTTSVTVLAPTVRNHGPERGPKALLAHPVATLSGCMGA